MKLVTYTIDFNSHRNPSGQYETPSSLFVGVDGILMQGAAETNGVSIDKPVFEVFTDRQQMHSDDGMAADLLDDFVSLEYDVTISYDPTPEFGDPRLVISAEATPEKLYVY